MDRISTTKICQAVGERILHAPLVFIQCLPMPRLMAGIWLLKACRFHQGENTEKTVSAVSLQV